MILFLATFAMFLAVTAVLVLLAAIRSRPGCARSGWAGCGGGCSGPCRDRPAPREKGV